MPPASASMSPPDVLSYACAGTTYKGSGTSPDKAAQDLYDKLAAVWADIKPKARGGVRKWASHCFGFHTASVIQWCQQQQNKDAAVCLAVNVTEKAQTAISAAVATAEKDCQAQLKQAAHEHRVQLQTVEAAKKAAVESATAETKRADQAESASRKAAADAAKKVNHAQQGLRLQLSA